MAISLTHFGCTCVRTGCAFHKEGIRYVGVTYSNAGHAMKNEFRNWLCVKMGIADLIWRYLHLECQFWLMSNATRFPHPRQGTLPAPSMRARIRSDARIAPAMSREASSSVGVHPIAPPFHDESTIYNTHSRMIYPKVWEKSGRKFHASAFRVFLLASCDARTLRSAACC